MLEQQDAPHLLSPSISLNEDEADAYRQLSDRIFKLFNPKDPLEEMWVQDVVDHSWEVRRLRNIKQKLVESALYRGLEVVLMPLAGLIEAPRLARGWQEKDPQMVDSVEILLKDSRVDMDMVRAETLALRIPEIERIDRCLHSAEIRRDKAVYDIDCFRAGFRERLKRENDKVLEATVVDQEVKVLENATE